MLMIADADCHWLMMIDVFDADWCYSIPIDADAEWSILMLTDADGCWYMLIDADWY